MKVVLDAYNPVGSTAHVSFHTSKAERYETDSRRCHVNWAMLDSNWEAELCRVAEAHPHVLAWVKNHNLGFTVPYRCGSRMRTYLPDFIVRVDDGRGADDPLHLVVEVKGYRGEDAKDKKRTMEAYWVPGVNRHGGFGRWAFAELTDRDDIAADLDELITRFRAESAREAAEWLMRMGGSAPELESVPRRRQSEAAAAAVIRDS